MRVLYGIGNDSYYGYGDAFCMEYSISYGPQEYRYFLTYYFSNHLWVLDPSNILNLCFTAFVLPGICDQDDVRFSHPSKKTYDKDTKEGYLVELITMDNDVSIKFASVGENNSRTQAKGDVAGNRVYDNLIDFSVWLSAFHQEIRMA